VKSAAALYVLRFTFCGSRFCGSAVLGSRGLFFVHL
jgi:hypothetical protein